MTTIGEILRNAREKRKLSLQQAENATRIRAKFLEALENNQFDQLPPGTFTKGFIKNYATFLGVKPDDALAFYRRQTSVEKAAIPHFEKNSDIRRRFQLTPQLFTAFGIGVLILMFFGYLVYSYFTFAGAPNLQVNSPENNSVTTNQEVRVTGKTDPEAVLTINDEAISVNEDGNFEQNISLQPGINTLRIVSTNKFKKQSTVNRTLRLEQ